MYGIIYKATNCINKKLYIGKTVRELQVRTNRHFQDAFFTDSNTFFHRAIRKYGRENFTWEIIDQAEDKEELNEKEKYWIQHYNSFIKFENSNGYNMTIGGDGASGEFHPFYNRQVPEDIRQKISVKLKGRYMGKDNPMAKAIIQLSLEGEPIAFYESMSTAERELGLEFMSHIGDCCNNKLASAHGYIWMYENEFTPSYIEDKLNMYRNGRIAYNRRSVVQLDINGNFINEHKSIFHAMQSLKKSHENGANIIKCCNQEIFSVYDSIWLYKENYCDEYVKLLLERYRTRKWSKKTVVKLKLDYEFVAEFETMVEASITVDGRRDGIWKACNNKISSYKGYRFMYKGDYLKHLDTK